MNERISAQAKAVLAVLEARRCHLTADEILACLAQSSTATVYRTLDHLTELGYIRRLSLGKKSAVYEYVRDEHMHFVCCRCGNVYDVPVNLAGMVREASACCGHRAQWGEVTAHGVCAACEAAQEA